MKHFISLVFAVITLGVSAQQHVKITDPTAFRLEPGIKHNKSAMAGLQAAGITAEQQELVLKYSDPELWPVGLRSDSARKANAPYIQNYTAFRTATFLEDSLTVSVLMIPAKDNIHMPEDLRPIADLYLVVPEKALQDQKTERVRPTISRGPRWKDNSEARILQPDQLFATYDIGADSAAVEAMRKRGMSQPEIDAVIFRCHERNWPEGIDTYDERSTRLEDFKKYKAYVGAKWGDRILLIIPVEKNKKMPVLERPYVDIYMVYSASAVQVKEKKKKK